MDAVTSYLVDGRPDPISTLYNNISITAWPTNTTKDIEAPAAMEDVLTKATTSAWTLAANPGEELIKLGINQMSWEDP